MKKLVLVGLVFAFCGGAVGASVAQDKAGVSDTPSAEQKQFDAGVAAYINADYPTALRLWAPLAERRNSLAQYSLGALYDAGRGVKRDYAAAASWYRKAADQGVYQAQYSLGVLTYKGQGITQDYAAAASWYRKAADQGYAPAQFNLGAMYVGGRGVTQDYAVAASWYRTAANQGNAGAQVNLGTLYSKGQGVPRDYVEAHKWFNLAAAGTSDLEVGKAAVANRDEVARFMTSAQIAEAQRLASEWRKK